MSSRNTILYGSNITLPWEWHIRDHQTHNIITLSNLTSSIVLVCQNNNHTKQSLIVIQFIRVQVINRLHHLKINISSIHIMLLFSWLGMPYISRTHVFYTYWQDTLKILSGGPWTALTKILMNDWTNCEDAIQCSSCGKMAPTN